MPRFSGLLRRAQDWVVGCSSANDVLLAGIQIGQLKGQLAPAAVGIEIPKFDGPIGLVYERDVKDILEDEIVLRLSLFVAKSSSIASACPFPSIARTTPQGDERWVPSP